MSDLDAIEARSTPRSFYSADGYALLAEVRALREQVATWEDGIRWEIVSTWDEKSADRLRALLDASHDQEQTDVR